MPERKETDPNMKIYTPRPVRTPPTQNTAQQEPELVRIWNGTRKETQG